jgi:ribosomal protein L16 Arg81 hydroxylase
VPNAQTFNASRVENDGKITQSQNLPVHLAPEYYNQGFAICFGDVSDISPELEELKKDTESLNDLFSNVLITCYLTPAMSTGVLHFDRQHNFFIQREGVKRWTVSRQPAVSNPIDNLVYPGSSEQFFSAMRKRGYSIKLPSECGKEVITLHPGDVLYLPPGYYHSPETTDSASLHYTLTLEPISFWSLIRPSLSRALLANSECFNKDLRFLSIEERESHIAAQKKLLADFILQLTTDELKMMLAESGTDS